MSQEEMSKAESKVQFARNLYKLMASRKLTLVTLAEKLNISKSSLHNYCNGVHPRNLETLNKIADFFQISVNDLIFGEKIELVGTSFADDIEGEYLVRVVRMRSKIL
ncbi:MAG: hypothetical protein A4S09_17535 [Proteobacteria bacterium SG_bin7]|nr:MAG: hypothetical protein A4S09_17535 [Proteobacteria bacterium SG_bin7]